MVQLKIDPKDIRGFNYHPSYSCSSYDDWKNFDAAVWEKELAGGKEKFPKMNTVRLWLSWNAYCCDEKKFIDHLRTAIEICKKLDLYVIPILFNRWHDPMIDCDGVYIDHFLPKASWLQKFGDPFTDYVTALANAFKDEEQILIWDICNEPLSYLKQGFEFKELIQKYELDWLRRMVNTLRQGGITQPVGLGSTGREPMAVFDDFIDVYLTHLYYVGGPVEPFEEKVLRFVNEARENDKPLIISECCWGSTDDKLRGDYIDVALSTFVKYDLGFIAHALQYCGCTDLHDVGDGRLTVNIHHPDHVDSEGNPTPSANIGNLCFVNKDGSLRPYHDAFNKY